MCVRKDPFLWDMPCMTHTKESLCKHMDQSEIKMTLKEGVESIVDIGDQQSVCSDTIKGLSNVKTTEIADTVLGTNPLTKADLPNRYTGPVL